MSHLELYSKDFKISIDMYNGVPTVDFIFKFYIFSPFFDEILFSCLENPKSPSLNTFPLFMTLAGFKSLN